MQKYQRFILVFIPALTLIMLIAAIGFTAWHYALKQDNKVSAAVCPSGFIQVPGSTKYGTSDFCVMKYEAKCALSADLTNGISTPLTIDDTYDAWAMNCNSENNRSIVSVASGAPIAAVTYQDAVKYSKSTCEGCHLMTEAQWMTIAENILSVPSNWTSGKVGEGSIYAGHTDDSPRKGLSASSDDEGYVGTGDSAPSLQRRTLKLSNGEVIWDFTGNVWEFTESKNISGRLGLANLVYGSWQDAYSIGSLAKDVAPSGVALSDTTNWLSHNNSLQLYNYTYNSKDEQDGLVRGGFYGTKDCGSMLTPYLNPAPKGHFTGIGFRVVR